MTDHFNAIRGTVTIGGVGNLTVSAAAAGKGRPLSAIPVGSSIALRFDDPDGVTWQVAMCTMLTATTLSRDTVLCGSNGTGAVTLAVGTSVLQTVVAEQLNAMLSVADIPFSTAIPLVRVGNSYMAVKTITGALTLTPAANAVRGALVYLRVIADGANLPNYSAFKEWGGSLGYDNRNGIENQMQFFFDGYNAFVSISQAVGATAVPQPASAVTMTGPTGGIISQASGVFTVGVSPVGGAITGAVVVTPSDGGAGGIFAPTSVSLSSGTTSGTFTYSPASTGAKTISVTNNGALTNPSAITFTVSMSATAPAAMAAPTATAGDTTASVTGAAPSNGGSAITGYTFTSIPAGMVDSNAGSTSLTHTMTGGTNGTAYTFTGRAANNVGTSAASPASNSVTLAASVARLSKLVAVTESAAAPFTYTGTDALHLGASPGPGGVLTTAFQDGVDGSASFVSGTAVSASFNEFILGVMPGANLVAFPGLSCALYTSSTDPQGAPYTPQYKVITNGSVAIGNGGALLWQTGDRLRVRRTEATLYLEVARSATPTTYILVHSVAITTGVLHVQLMVSGTSVATGLMSTGLA